MKILILCGAFAKENEAEILSAAKLPVDFAANLFQRKLISGIKRICRDVRVVSAPFIGPYPTASHIKSFTGFQEEQQEYTYVPFHNLWGYRNLSRARMLKRAIKDFILDSSAEKLMILYSAHTPFLRAAAYAKQRDSRIKICMVVPDLPMYMNLSANRSLVYRFAKRIDMMALYRKMGSVDAFVLLTEQMREKLPINGKPTVIIEGILDNDAMAAPLERKRTSVRNITYTGGMNEKYGVRTLVDAFETIPEQDCRLVLCGAGDCTDYIQKMCKIDSRIHCLGQVTPDEAREQQAAAAVLVNPRPNRGAYTKYSFPSKIIEYLASGKPTVAYMLDGMPKCYAEFLYEISPEGDEREAIAEAIRMALNDADRQQQARNRAFMKYARGKLTPESVARQILQLSGFQDIQDQ